MHHARTKQVAPPLRGPALALLLLCAGAAQAQSGPPPQPARETAPFDPTGYWVSLVTEDWRYRMVPPPQGDFTGVPLNAEGQAAADAWDPAIGGGCMAYGAPTIMRDPGRLHITWQDENTLRIDTDAGAQTRLLQFARNAPPPTAASRQGHTRAEWLIHPANGFGTRGPRHGSLKAVTTDLLPGLLRSNGAPYSAAARVTEHFDLVEGNSGEQYLIVLSTVEDPQYLYEPFTTSSNFRREADGRGWDPQPCAAP